MELQCAVKVMGYGAIPCQRAALKGRSVKESERS
jgi:hypothetical protein